MNSSTQTKIILVVGSSRGIGKCLVELLANQSPRHLVLALSRNVEGLAALSPHNNIHAHILDLEDTINCRARVEEILSAYPKVDVCINNAGAIVVKPFLELTPEDINRCYNVNAICLFYTCQAVIPKMLDHGGHIVQISSVGGFQGSVKFGGLSAYATSKAAACSLTELLAEEYKGTKVRTNCLCLGAVQTEMLEAAFPGYQAPVSAPKMAEYIAHFALTAHEWMHGKIVPVSCSTP